MAINNHNPNSLVVATIAQAKLLGLDKPIKDATPHDEPVVFNITGVSVDKIADYSMLTDDELRQLIAITEKIERVTAHD